MEANKIIAGVAFVSLMVVGCVATQSEIKTNIVKIHKHRWDYDTGRCWICDASFSPMKVKSKTALRLNKNSKQVMINAIMIEFGLSEPDATILWEKYKRSEIEGFAGYLIETNPFQKIDRVYTDLVERVKVRTKILKRERR